MVDEKLDMILRKLHHLSKSQITNSADTADDSGCLPDGITLPQFHCTAYGEIT